MRHRLPFPTSAPRTKAIRRAFREAVPDTRILIRRADGSSSQLALGRGRLLAAGAIAAGCVTWAALATALLLHQPERLATRERQLDELMASTRATQQRLAMSQKMVAEITREVDMVESSLKVLVESNASLVRGRGGDTAMNPKTPPSLAPSVTGEGNEPEGETRAVRDQIRRLETSLERLRTAYAQAVQSTSDAAIARVSDAEQSLARLGIDAGRVIGKPRHEAGQGGPFVPINASITEPALSGMLVHLDRWSGMQAALRTLPLGEPLHQPYEVSSGFGHRNDPLNRRTGVHEGVDLVAPHGSPIHATGEGVVAFAGAWDRYGLVVEIDHGTGITTRYAHLSRLLVHEGQRVGRASVIGLLGNTGRSTGPHLHYEVRLSETPRDPVKFIAAGEHALRIW